MPWEWAQNAMAVVFLLGAAAMVLVFVIKGGDRSTESLEEGGAAGGQEATRQDGVGIHPGSGQAGSGERGGASHRDGARGQVSVVESGEIYGGQRCSHVLKAEVDEMKETLEQAKKAAARDRKLLGVAMSDLTLKEVEIVFRLKKLTPKKRATRP